MKTVILYGELAKRFGKVHRFAIRNAGEALRALKANRPGFERFMNEAHLHGMRFKLFVGGHGVREYDEVHHPAGRADIIRLVPVIQGSKSGWVQALVGVVLVAAAVLAAPFTGGTSLLLVQGLGALGASLIIGGISRALSSPPETPKEVSRKESHLFSGPVNTSAQGAAIPVGYGRLIVGSIVISSGIEAYETA